MELRFGGAAVQALEKLEVDNDRIIDSGLSQRVNKGKICMTITKNLSTIMIRPRSPGIPAIAEGSASSPKFLR